MLPDWLVRHLKWLERMVRDVFPRLTCKWLLQLAQRWCTWDFLRSRLSSGPKSEPPTDLRHRPDFLELGPKKVPSVLSPTGLAAPPVALPTEHIAEAPAQSAPSTLQRPDASQKPSYDYPVASAAPTTPSSPVSEDHPYAYPASTAGTFAQDPLSPERVDLAFAERYLGVPLNPNAPFQDLLAIQDRSAGKPRAGATLGDVPQGNAGNGAPASGGDVNPASGETRAPQSTALSGPTPAASSTNTDSEDLARLGSQLHGKLAALPADPTLTGLGNELVEGQAGVGLVVANYTTTDMSVQPGQLQATIDWGDSTSSIGVPSGGGGSFQITGDHRYAEEGNYTLHRSRSWIPSATSPCPPPAMPS